MKRPNVPESPYRLYILMRTDLPSMNPGRGMAQAAHAANQFIHEYGASRPVEQWQKGAEGFGTTICLAATEENIKSVMELARKNNYRCGYVYDPTYKFELDKELATLIDEKHLTAPTILKDNGKYMMFRNELTCAYLFISSEDPYRETLVGHLFLHP